MSLNELDAATADLVADRLLTDARAVTGGGGDQSSAPRTVAVIEVVIGLLAKMEPATPPTSRP